MGLFGWMAMVGGMLLLMALLSSHVERLPISTSFIYLLVGVAIGPAGAGLVSIDVIARSEALERLAELAVIVSLFVGGLRLRLPLKHPSWQLARNLAGPVMLMTVIVTAVAAHWLVGASVFMALLLAGALAPTDPVLANAVTVNNAEDHDRVRVALSGEAGMNDGAAFPFVLLALEAMRFGAFGAWIAPWALLNVVWGVVGGVAIGYALGAGLGHVAVRLRTSERETTAPNDIFTLALIALAYSAAHGVHALGFLAVFAAGVGLRHAEVRVVNAAPHPDVEPTADTAASAELTLHPPAETLVHARVTAESLEQPAMAVGVLISEALSFGDTIGRLLEVLLMVIVGIALVQAWSFAAALLAITLFLVIRPLSIWVLVRDGHTTRRQRALIAWFGIRGIGSLYCLGYALNHGVTGRDATLLVEVVLTVVACSAMVHGISVTPILTRYEASKRMRSGVG